MRPATRTRWALTLAAAALALTGCAASGPRTGAFDSTTDSRRAHCRAHQRVLPDGDYTGGAGGRTLAVLGMLKYYTAKGALPFCDGRPATAQDTAWTRLYGRLTHP
ncbi:hypothetical protein [Streptomyces sp. NBC_01190]|uniref:hypothetical protein n=1 Tax=Streptomyces sp. NBC_01190 TaxID=2903767 RepID=UPI00386B62FF|nr:hypothetical protein OG519_10615 [Streptomyces sp. NBC_01190]